MGLIFNIPQKSIDFTNPIQAVKQIWKYISSLQEQLEQTLTSLDSDNITEISTDKTKITNSTGSTAITGEMISYTSGRYSFVAGNVTDSFGVKTFKFEVTDGSGNKVLYLSGGNLVISRHADITIDGGVW